MPTIIDSLVVKLGLDSKDLSSKAPAATKEVAGIEKQVNSANASVENFTSTIAKFLAVLGGTVALKSFVSDFIETNSQLERFSRNIGLSLPTVSAWGNAVEEMGGSARDAQGALDLISKAQTELSLTGQSSLIPYLSALGISLADATGKARPADQVLTDIGEALSKLDRTQGNNLGRMIGFDQNTLNVILQGRRAIELTIQRQKDYAASTKAAGEIAVKFQRQIVDLRQNVSAFGRDLLVQASPAIEKILNGLSGLVDWVRENKEFVVDFFKVVGAGLLAIGIAAAPINLTVSALLALGAAIALVWQDYQTWKRGGDSFIDWGIWKDRIDAVTGAIAALRGELGKLESAATSALNKIPGFKKFDKSFTDHVNSNNKPNPLAGAGGAAKSILGIKDPASITRYFIAQGWTPAQAAGIAANITAESSGNPNATGDNGNAYGLAQWHKDRQANFKALYGRDIQGSSLEQQLAFIQYELTRGTEKGAGDALRNSTSASGAGSIVSRLYERPGDVAGEAARRAAAAQSMLDSFGSQGRGAAGNTTSLSIDKVTVYTQATDANGIARDFTHSMDYLLTSQANSGLN